MIRQDGIVERLMAVAGPVARARACLSGAAGAHAHLAAATESLAREPVRYVALRPRTWEVVGPDHAALTSLCSAEGLSPGEGEVEQVVRTSWPLFVSRVLLADGTAVPVLTREAILAVLLSRGGLSIGLAGILMRGAGIGVDADDVRELLKAARQPERFQPMLELLDVA